jgi:hypothetical protein
MFRPGLASLLSAEQPERSLLSPSCLADHDNPSAKMGWISARVRLQNFVSWANLLIKEMAIAGIRCNFGYPTIGLLRSIDALALLSDSSDQVSIRGQDPSPHCKTDTSECVSLLMAL